MSKKNLLAVFVLATAGFFTSCSSDDDKTTPIVEEPITEEPTPHALEGTWKAETVSYVVPGIHSGGPYPFDHEMMKQGCGTDYLTIEANSVAELKEDNKVDGVCTDVLKAGTWTAETIVIGEQTRTVSSVTETELVLEYQQAMMGSVANLTVTYSKQ